MGLIERWTIHETGGPGLIRPGKFNAVVSGRALNEGEKIEVVRASDYEGAVSEAAWLRRALTMIADGERDPAHFARLTLDAEPSAYGGQ